MFNRYFPMKNIVVVLVILAAAFGFGPASLAQNVEPTYYGEKITEDGAVAASEVPALMKKKKEVTLKVKGKIVKTCVKKGCWMSVDLGNGQKMTVKFKDYAFFVPKTGAEGLDVVFEGVARKEVRSVAELKHYAEDGGKSKEEIESIKKPSDEITFEAKGVIIRGYQKS
jgi:hypothetical protein